jgi:predicted site-specific integrase-resolvase
MKLVSKGTIKLVQEEGLRWRIRTSNVAAIYGKE